MSMVLQLNSYEATLPPLPCLSTKLEMFSTRS